MEPGLYTFEEAARLTGLSIEALRKRARRPGPNQLHMTTSNEDKLQRVQLDERTIQAIQRANKAGQVTGRPGALERDNVKFVNALSKAVEVLQEQLDIARTDLDAARGEVTKERERANAAEAHFREAGALADKRVEELSDLKERLARTEGVLAGLKQAADQSWWRRLTGKLRP
jgi:uncharacterized coiled-coil DUF342 family protein